MKIIIQPKYLSGKEIQRLIEDHRKRIAPQEELMVMVKSMVKIKHNSQEVFNGDSKEY